MTLCVKHIGPHIVGQPIRLPQHLSSKQTIGPVIVEPIDAYLQDLSPEFRQLIISEIKSSSGYFGDQELEPAQLLSRKILEAVYLPIIETGQFPPDDELNRLMTLFSIDSRDSVEDYLLELIKGALVKIAPQAGS